MTPDEAGKEWARVNAAIRDWNRDCSIEYHETLPQSKWDYCFAQLNYLTHRQAVIRARLNDLGIPIAGEVQPPPAAPQQPTAGGQPPGRGFNLTSPHAHDLGSDAAHSWHFNPSEALTGLRVEAERGVDLIRSSNPQLEWVDPATGYTYDAVGPFSSQFFDSQWPNFQREIARHIGKATYVPVDVSTFTPGQRAIVRTFVEGLGNAHVFIVGDY
jgi:hypothetical protein